tara:strand:+ start:57 stop:428 length:372 start_codon:yes stop_codon:yes gene_type:complete
MNGNEIVYAVCEAAGCSRPDPDEDAWFWVVETFNVGVQYTRDREDYDINELAEATIPYNNYKIANIWVQLQLYRDNSSSASNLIFEDRLDSRLRGDFITMFQSMLYSVAQVGVRMGRDYNKSV